MCFLHIFNLIHFCAYENTRDWERSTILFPFFHLNSFQSHYKTTSSSLFHCCCARGKIAKGLWSRPKCTMFGIKSLDIKANSIQTWDTWYTVLSETFKEDRIWNFGIKPTDGTTRFVYLAKGKGQVISKRFLGSSLSSKK